MISDAQSKILDELTDKIFDVEGIKEFYDILMEDCLVVWRNQRILK